MAHSPTTHSPTTGQFAPQCSSPAVSNSHSTPRHPSDSNANTTASPAPSYEIPSPKRVRTIFSSNDLALLEAAFYVSSYPDTSAKKILGDALCFDIKTLSVWFQNRRARARKDRRKIKHPNITTFTQDELALLRKYENACRHTPYTPLFWPLLF